ncbi:N-acetylglucosamine-1-phosphate uridyltransferase [Photobacterium aphoticum]|uniref:N-acetylglucosamine-1-phosphate uridyltransferase n=1 Tax=Photobacterium aphoticum TaxID=754436 RepID=A0A090R113_9GAMM|nr:N-acetylglucosamine-1-phosphate uridyltransferase [Photobacterium aphoticum]
MIGKGATIGAGSTINKNVGEGALVVTRVAPRTVDGWKRPVKKERVAS